VEWAEETPLAPITNGLNGPESEMPPSPNGLGDHFPPLPLHAKRTIALVFSAIRAKIVLFGCYFAPCSRGKGVPGMPLMSRKVDYAILILSALHQRPDGGCARAIADGFGLSRSFVANILKELCQKGFVTSRRGVKGGYALQRPAEDITLADLLQALDDSFQLAECTRDGAGEVCCIAPICPVRGQIAEVHRRIGALLRTVTLAELCRPVEDAGAHRLHLDVIVAGACAGRTGMTEEHLDAGQRQATTLAGAPV
jgi:Rrf2 family protein